MSLYCVKFKLLSHLMNIPNSQSIFGTICHYYEDKYGKEKLEEILEKENSNNPVFVVSSMFIDNVLPLPMDFIPKRSNNIELKDVKLFKKVKKVKFMSLNLFKELKKDKIKFEDSFYSNISSGKYVIEEGIIWDKNLDSNIAKPKVKDEIRTRVNVLDEQFYQDIIKHYSDDTTFVFYVDIKNKDYEDELIELFKSLKYVNIGGKKSIGYNLYNYFDIQKVDDLLINKRNVLLSLAVGNDNVNFDESYYQFININNKFNNSKKTVNRNNVYAFCEGSVISTDKDYIGCLIKEENDGQITYQNMLGLLI